MTPIRETIARAITEDAWDATYEMGRTSLPITGGAAHIPEAEAKRIADAVLRALDEAGLAAVPKEPTAAMLAAVAPIASGKPSPEAMAQAGAVLEDLRAPITWNAYIGIAQLADDYRAMIAAAVVE